MNADLNLGNDFFGIFLCGKVNIINACFQKILETALSTSPIRLSGLLKDRHLAKKVCVDIAKIPLSAATMVRALFTNFVPPVTILISRSSSQGVVRCTNTSTGAQSLIHADRIRLHELRRHTAIFVDTNIISVVA